jgi:hypothetical protein
MPTIPQLLDRKPNKADYLLIGNGSATINNVIRYFSFQPEFQITFLESKEKVIRRGNFVYVLLDGTDYTNTEFSKVHTYFNGKIPNLIDAPYMLKLNNSVVDVKETGTYKPHNHKFQTEFTSHGSYSLNGTSNNVLGGAGNQISSGNKELIIGSSFFQTLPITYQHFNFVIPKSKIINYYIKMKMD